MAKNSKKQITEDDEPKAMRIRPADDETVDTADEASEVVEEVPAPKVEVPSLRKGWVRFNCFVLVDPAPTVGTFSFVHDANIPKLEERKVYSCPLTVAEHLVDKKIGVILPD